MSRRVLTLHLRQRLTPDERRRLRRALEVPPDDIEPPTRRIGRRVCHGEVPRPWAVALAIRLGDFACAQLSRQEGLRVDFKAAILVEPHGLLAWWGLPGEVVVVPWEDGQGVSPSPSWRAHPPTLALPREESYPMDVPYRISAGPLAARVGELHVTRSRTIHDHVFAMS